MDFIIGGSYQGKRKYVEKSYGEASVFEGADDPLEKLACAQVVFDFHLLIKRLLQSGMETEQIGKLLDNVTPDVIVTNEIGYGLVPIDPFERMYRETVGRQCCQIAKRARKVVRISCGIPTVIKQEGLEILMVRHGLTIGNEQGRYVGITDESLSDKGRKELVKTAQLLEKFNPDLVWSSPMKRCVETARLLFPKKEVKLVEGFEECNFGEFEYKNYQELNHNPEYQKFIDSNGLSGFPNGELPEVFRARCQEAFLREVESFKKNSSNEGKKIAMIVHGGTIMSILDKFSEPNKDYFSWQVKNGNGFTGRLLLEDMKITELKKLW